METDKSWFSTKQLNIREDKNKGVYIENLTEEYVESEEDVLKIMENGNGMRAVSSTNMNSESSQSHSIFILTISQSNTEGAKSGKLYLVDLAGSEKISKTG